MFGRVNTNQSLLGPGPNNTSYNQSHNQYQQQQQQQHPLLIPSNMHQSNLNMIHSTTNNRLQSSNMDFNNNQKNQQQFNNNSYYNHQRQQQTPIALHHQHHHHHPQQNFNPNIRTKASFQMKNNSLLAGPQSTTTHQHPYQKPLNKPNFNMNNNNNATKRRPQQHNNMMINKQHQNNTINKQQIQNEEQTNLNKLKICMEANRRNINQRLNINNNNINNNNNSNNGQTRQNQQQSDNNRFQNNKQLILIKTDENDNNSSKNTGLKRPLESSNETEITKKICQEMPIVDVNNEADKNEDRSVIKVECKIKNKLSNDENYEIDAFYCKCCCQIIHDEATIKEHLITDTHKTNKCQNSQTKLMLNQSLK